MREYIGYFFGYIRLVREYLWNHGRVKLHGYKYYLGRGVKIATYGRGICNLGKKTWIGDNGYFSASGGNIILGFNNYFNSNCKVVAKQRISIGDNNLFGPNVVIVDHNHCYRDSSKLICKQGFDVKPITIGSDVWIGANVVISSGVSIGSHIVVGANSVVTKDLKEAGVYGGIPAKKIK